MGLSNPKIEKIAHLVIQVLYSRFENFPKDSNKNRNAPFHEAFLRAFSDELKDKVIQIPFFISLSSWLHASDVYKRQVFFENVAHILSDGEKREYTSGKLGNLQITKRQKENISRIMTELSNSSRSPDLDIENESIYIDDSSERVNAIDFSADVFYVEDSKIVAIELKSVKPNSGEMRGEKHKILEGKAALYKKFPGRTIEFYIGFPFDPTDEKPTGSNKDRFMDSIVGRKKYFHPSEILLGEELWDKLSGVENTMEEILKIINSISNVDFMKKYDYLVSLSLIHI